MNRLKSYAMILLVIIVVLFSILNIWLIFSLDKSHENRVQGQINHIYEIINELPKPINVTNGKDGYTPIKGIDYTDGANGKNGTDGKNGINGIDGTNGKDGMDGLTPDIRCNTTLNAWQVRYGSDELWQVLGDEPVKCTI